VGIQIKRAASFVRSAKHLVSLRFELVSTESEFHPDFIPAIPFAAPLHQHSRHGSLPNLLAYTAT